MLRGAAVAVLCAVSLAAAAQAQVKQPKDKPQASAKAKAKKPAAAQVDTQVIGQILACLQPGLPEDWKKAWVVVTELDSDGRTRKFEAQFFYATSMADERGEPLKPCDAEAVAMDVYRLNDGLKPEQRQWKVARLVITSEGDFELKYDYTR
jgi:hypothetical protein